MIAGGVILFPSLATLFRLTLSGRFDLGSAGTAAVSGPGAPGSARPQRVRLRTRLAAGSLLVGVGLVNVASSNLAHGIGALFFVAFLALGFRIAVPLDLD